MPVQPIDHASWCDRKHPETDDGQSYMVLERNHVRPHCQLADQALIDGLFDALVRSLAEAGTPVPRQLTDAGPVIRLCAAARLRTIERQATALISATHGGSRRIM